MEINFRGAKMKYIISPEVKIQEILEKYGFYLRGLEIRKDEQEKNLFCIPIIYIKIYGKFKKNYSQLDIYGKELLNETMISELEKVLNQEITVCLAKPKSYYYAPLI